MIFSKLCDLPDAFRLLVATTLTAVAGGAAIYYAYQFYTKRKSLPTKWEEVGTVTRLFIHPLKSGGALAVKTAKATLEGLSNGLLVDRSFIVYTEDGEMVTGRQVGKLTTLKASCDGKHLTISLKDGDQVSLDIIKLDQKECSKSFRLRETTVQGVDCGDEVAEWLTKHLYEDSTKVRLVYKGGAKWKRPKKKLDYFNFPNFGENDTTLFNDSCSYMIMTESSMDDLNQRLQTPVDFSWFRPCIVIGGTKPYDEDSWAYVKIGEKIVIHEAKPREICLLTQIDPADGTRKTDHFEMLQSYRTVTSPLPLAKKWKANPIFGVHCGIDVEGDIKVGDKVYVARGRQYWVAKNSRNTA